MTDAGPLADSNEIKGFYKGYFRQNKGRFIEILTKIKSKLKTYAAKSHAHHFCVR